MSTQAGPPGQAGGHLAHQGNIQTAFPHWDVREWPQVASGKFRSDVGENFFMEGVVRQHFA